GGTLFITKADVQYWAASPEPRERVAKLVKEGWLWRGQIIARGRALRHPGFLTDLDVLNPDELNQSRSIATFGGRRVLDGRGHCHSDSYRRKRHNDHIAANRPRTYGTCPGPKT